MINEILPESIFASLTLTDPEELSRRLGKVSQSEIHVLITGECAASREFLAKNIHLHSFRNNNNFISISCANLPEYNLESEIFGHEKGSLPNNITMRKGGLESADNGTLFLDEIDEMPSIIQWKLINYLNTKDFNRTGSNNNYTSNIRFIAGSKRDLKLEVDKGRFSDKLYYLINVASFNILPLRDTKSAISSLIIYLIKKYSLENNLNKISVNQEAMKLLMNYNWPGNIIQLKNVIREALTICDNNTITPNDLSQALIVYNYNLKNKVEYLAFSRLDIDRFIPLNTPLPEALDAIEEQMIRRALEKSGQVQVRAAELLGITKSLLQYKLKKYHLTT